MNTFFFFLIYRFVFLQTCTIPVRSPFLITTLPISRSKWRKISDSCKLNSRSNNNRK